MAPVISLLDSSRWQKIRNICARVDTEFVRKIFTSVAHLFTDPRQEQDRLQHAEKAVIDRKYDDETFQELEYYIQNKYFADTERNATYQLGVLSSLSALRTGYYKLHGWDNRQS
jgi:hypothetical protein